MQVQELMTYNRCIYIGQLQVFSTPQVSISGNDIDTVFLSIPFKQNLENRFLKIDIHTCRSSLTLIGYYIMHYFRTSLEPKHHSRVKAKHSNF